MCGLRGNGWGRNHKTVNYAFTHSPYMLYEYHLLVMNEMRRRGYKGLDKLWYNALYRGLKCEPYTYEELNYEIHSKDKIYKEHNEEYLRECLDNLKSKGIDLNILKEVV